MIVQNEIDFIKEYFLRKGEQLEFPQNIHKDTGFIDIQIIKKTERTLRLTGLLTIARHHEKMPSHPDETLIKEKITPFKKLRLHDHDPHTIQWFQEGWILKEIRFKKDGKTPESQHYRMGFRLYQYEQKRLKAEEEKLEQAFQQWKTKFRLLDTKPVQLREPKRTKGVNALLQSLEQIAQLQTSQLKESNSFPQWQLPKRLKFLEFLIAFLEICMSKTAFDWKEIGAAYYKEIGGSKEFDSYKDEFIEQLENLAQCPVALLGLTSLGKITSLYFSGPIKGNYSFYQYGPVHALTDLSISQDQYSTNAETLWLVENRAVLTRIASEKEFLKEMNSLMICVDGHLRSSHKQCIIQLLKNSPLTQVLIWTDYDPDGMQIAGEVYQIILDAGTNPRVKWVTANHDVLESWNEYAEYMDHFLNNNRMEQEEVLGGADDWKKWVLH